MGLRFIDEPDLKSLNADESREAFSAIMSGLVPEVRVTSFLRAIADRGVTRDELLGAAIVMRERATRIDTSHINRPILDTCGTGGDVKGTFNISTAAAIVAASAGAAVVKHGNRSASGRSGSADVLEALGVKIDADSACLKSALDQANICFAFARAHHPAMKHVAAARKTLGVPTIFNLLGPLTNPAHAKRQLIGVYDAKYTELLAGVLLELGSEQAWVVHGEDGLDELSTMSPTRVSILKNGMVKTETFDATTLGFARANLADLRADTPAESAEVIRRILRGERGAPRDIVVLNASAALVVAGVADEIVDARSKVESAIDSGRSTQTLEALVRASHAR